MEFLYIEANTVEVIEIDTSTFGISEVVNIYTIF